jgi:hypothetical protein
VANLPNVIFIGGASASGKSTAARDLSSKTDRPYLELDRLYNSVKDILSNSGLPDKVVKDITKSVSLEFVRGLIGAETQCVIEGGWITPKVAAGLTSDSVFEAVYCGYTDIKAAERLQNIKSAPGDQHWLSKKPDEFALDFLTKQIADSQSYKNQCQEHGHTYFDFSDQTTGANKLLKHFMQ